MQTHHLYLASFGGSEVKVGTASDRRREARLIDQGPLFAIRVAAGTGPRIKQLEHVVSHQTAAVEGMRRSRKLALLRGVMTAEQAEERVMAAHAALIEVANPDYTDLLHDPDPLRLPRLARETRAELRAETELPIEQGCRLEGMVVGAVGHIAVLEDSEGRFVLDLGKLVGHLVDLDPPASSRRSQVQLGLF
ncbi:MAG: DUF2797 domain-containing protein [Proteobacteria bacterium]|nr:DUF2797 domain-containing protein [Pseudomonadota bacterium]